jgi:carboxypeptidase family protein
MRRTLPTVAVVAACSFMLAPRAVRAQSETPGGGVAATAAAAATHRVGVIGGLVTDTRGVGLAGAHVNITDHVTGRGVDAVTQDDGRFAIGGLAMGRRYTLSVRRIGFAPRTQASAPVAADDQSAAGSISITLAPIEPRTVAWGR